MTKLDTIDGGPLPIDLEHLSQYTAHDPAVTRDILGLFKDQVNLKFDALKGATDLADWKEQAHALKGTALGVGAGELAALALEAEALLGLGSGEHDDLLERLEKAALRAVQYAAQLLEDSSFAG